MQPESSDGFASVGTILPKEEAALLPGGLFASRGMDLERPMGGLRDQIHCAGISLPIRAANLSDRTNGWPACDEVGRQEVQNA